MGKISILLLLLCIFCLIERYGVQGTGHDLPDEELERTMNQWAGVLTARLEESRYEAFRTVRKRLKILEWEVYKLKQKSTCTCGKSSSDEADSDSLDVKQSSLTSETASTTTKESTDIDGQQSQCEEAYEIFTTRNKFNFEGARQACKNKGGELMSKEVLGFGAVGNKYFYEIQGVLSWEPYWIGMSDREIEGTFRWVNDNSLYDPDAPVEQKFVWKCENGECEPNNLHNEDCVEIFPNYGMNDRDCGAEVRALCQKKLPC